MLIFCRVRFEHHMFMCTKRGRLWRMNWLMDMEEMGGFHTSSLLFTFLSLCSSHLSSHFSAVSPPDIFSLVVFLLYPVLTGLSPFKNIHSLSEPLVLVRDMGPRGRVHPGQLASQSPTKPNILWTNRTNTRTCQLHTKRHRAEYSVWPNTEAPTKFRISICVNDSF